MDIPQAGCKAGNCLFRQPGYTCKIASNLLKDYGYFDGNVTYTVDSTRNPRAVKLSYQINMGKPYLIDTVLYEGFPGRADSLIRKHFDERLIHSNENFDVTRLNEERERLVTMFKNNGYYFSEANILLSLPIR